MTSPATALLSAVNAEVIGKELAVELAVVCLLTEGHLLVEDNPGTGKTTLARALASASGGSWNRIQFTPDLLPTDVTGVSIYNQGTTQFEFHEGPVFSNVVLADEINRASPKTQSALLEVMEEQQVTGDGVTRPVPRPFTVVATQNPVEMEGTYRLPEAQLDRFLMRLRLGYLDAEHELRVITGSYRASSVDRPAPTAFGGHRPIGHAQAEAMHSAIVEMVAEAARVTVSDALGRYVVELAAATRHHPRVRLGVSTRGALAMVRACRSLAFVRGRDYVNASDVQELAPHVWSHRLILTPEAELGGVTDEQLVAEVLAGVTTPDVAPTQYTRP